jgi:hypothetical protein
MSLMDTFLPQHQFSKRHQVTVRCDPGRLLDVIQDFRPPRDRVGEMAMRIRQLPASLMHSLAAFAGAATPAVHPGELHAAGAER